MSNVIPYYTSARNVNNSSANLSDYDAYVTDLFHGTIGNYVFGYSSTYNTIFRSDVSTDASITIVLNIEYDPDILLYIPLTEETGILFLDESSEVGSILVYDINWTDSTYIYRTQCDYVSHFSGYDFYFNEVVGVAKNSDNIIAVLSFGKYVSWEKSYIDFLLYDNTNNVFTFINGPESVNDDYYCGDSYPKYFSDLGNGICLVTLDTGNHPEDPENLSNSYIAILNTNNNTCNFVATPRLVDNPLAEGNYYYDLSQYYSLAPNYIENSFYLQSLYAQYTSGSWAYSTKILKIDTLGNIYPSRELTSGSSGDTNSFVLSYSKNKIISSHYNSGSLIFYDVSNGSEISSPSYFNETTVSQNLDDSTNEVVILKYSELSAQTIELISEANMANWEINTDTKEGYENGWNWDQWIDNPQFSWTAGISSLSNKSGVYFSEHTDYHRLTHSDLVDSGTIPYSNLPDNFITLNNLISGSIYMITTDGIIQNDYFNGLGWTSWYSNAFRIRLGDGSCDLPFECTTFGKSQANDFTAGSVVYLPASPLVPGDTQEPGFQGGNETSDELHAEIYFAEGDLGTEINHHNADIRYTYDFYEIFIPAHMIWQSQGSIDYSVYNATEHLYETSFSYPVNRYVKANYYVTAKLYLKYYYNYDLDYHSRLGGTIFLRLYFSDGTTLETATSSLRLSDVTLTVVIPQGYDNKFLVKVIVGKYYDSGYICRCYFVVNSLRVDALITNGISDKLLKTGTSGSTLLYDFGNIYLFRSVYYLKLSNSLLLIPTIEGANNHVVMHKDYYATTGNLFQIIWWNGG